MPRPIIPITGMIALCVYVSIGAAEVVPEQDDGDGEAEFSEITVRASRVANTRPAGTYASPATALRFDPQTELQSRGLPEGQADVTVRGSLFENTGFKVGAVTIMDPQTGHYAAELPIDPASLSPPDVRTGIDNAITGFNSNIATIEYSIPTVQAGGSLSLGAGSDDLSFGSLRFARVHDTSATADIAVAAAVAFSEGDGSLPDGDHEFQRYNLQIQRSSESAQTDLILAYQDKFYGWPGAYTGFATLAETDDTQTTLLLANHRGAVDNGWWQLGAFYRRLEDDYDFDRTTDESGAPGSFDHETRVFGVGIDGVASRGNLEWHYAAQLTSDELVRSTDLTNGKFTQRDYGTVSVVPSIDITRSDGNSLTVRFGATADLSSRDSSAVSPVLGATLQRVTSSGVSFFRAEYAATSQLPGYTVLGSGPSGLFGGNPDLGREKARQFLLSMGRDALDWQGTVSLFYRQDDDLVDWTYSGDSPFARLANPVDIDVFGAELLYSRTWQSLDLNLGYTFLDKDEDYGTAAVDASFYALNFARHRATLALRYRFGDRFELRLDNEYREQESNPLRNSGDQAFVVSASVAWGPAGDNGFGLAVTADNLTDDDYEQFPGTPAVGRQVSVSARYVW